MIVGLVGPNGAGKSTLFNVMSGLLNPSRGKLRLDGEDITPTRPQVRAGMGLSRTFQHPELFTGLTVREHLVIAHRVRHAKQRIWTDLFTMGSVHPATPEEQADVDGLIELLGLGPVAARPAQGLPLGWARLVELGRALASSPTVLLLDEPSAGLDSSETEQFENTLRNATRARGISVLLVEHNVELVMRMCATVYVLDFGVLIASGPPDEVRADPQVRAAYLGEEVAAEGETKEADEVAEVSDSLHAHTVKPDRKEAQAADERPAVLTVKNLSIQYGDAVALSGVSFGIGTGEALAVLGANGAGKSSLARGVTGLVRLRAGQVVLDGQEISSWAAYKIRRAGVVHLPEERGVFRDLTVMDNLRMAVAPLRDRQARRDSVDRMLELFPPLAARRRQKARLLSGGEQQMLALARALATSPKLLIADEMSLGLAPQMVDLVFDGLEHARQAGVTVIIIEQYIHRALAHADVCIMLQRGTLVWQGPASAAGGELVRHYLGEVLTSVN
jgi:ABC-type branched-subunit amino acid transport system ATPase component